MSNPYYPDYLMHHGVKGMKWGVRKKKYYMDDGSLTRYGKLKSKKGQMSRAEYRKAKKKYKSDVNDQYRKLNSTTSLGQKLLYNNPTRKRAAEYMVNRKMSRTDAEKSAKKDAWRNAAIATAGYLVANRVANAATKKYFNNRARNQAVDAYSQLRGGLNEYSGPSRFKSAASKAYNAARSMKNRGKNKVKRNKYGLTTYRRQGPIWRS